MSRFPFHSYVKLTGVYIVIRKNFFFVISLFVISEISLCYHFSDLIINGRVESDFLLTKI